MSKKILKRSLALGALMAFVITGSAMAAKNDFIHSGVLDMNNLSGTNFVSGTTYDNINVTNDKTVHEKWDISSGVLMSGVNDFKAKESIIISSCNSGILSSSDADESKLTLSAPVIIIKDVQDNSGIHLQGENSKVFIRDFGNLSINATSNIPDWGWPQGTGIRIFENGTLIDAIGNVGSSVEIHGANNGIAMTANGQIRISAGTIAISSLGHPDKVMKTYKGHAIANTGGGTIDIFATNSITITSLDKSTHKWKDLYAVYAENGEINIYTADGAKDKADVIVNGDVKAKGNGKIDLKLETQGSVLNGSIMTEGDGAKTNFVLSSGAIWNNYSYDDFEDIPDNKVAEENKVSSVTNFELNGGVVKQTSETRPIKVDTLTGSGGTFEVENATSEQMVIGTKNEGTQLTVSTKNQDVKAEDLIDVAVMSTSEEGKLVSAANFVEKTGGPIYSSEKYAVDNGTLGESVKVVDSANLGVNDMAALSLMSWRAETNDMNKRMGELRNANGEHGVWVRMVGGEDEYKSTEYEYTQYQLGYDEKLSTDPSWTVGVALSYTDGDTKFTNGSGEFENKGVSIYGSKLNEDGSFIDLIAKYSRMENDFKTISGMGEGDYGTNAYSVSAEYGKRFEQGKDLWIEPQVELTYGKVSAVDYVAKNNVHVAQDGMESLVGRIGFSLGKNIKQGNVYARASYLYDFDGETKVVLDGVESFDNDLGGGWWEVGVGTNINLSKATYIYADVEKTFGGEVDTNWQWNLGVRYSF